MLRIVAKDDVRLGMYIHRLEGAWLKHPFWRKSFLLTDPDDLEVIRGGDFTAIVIDDSKSLIPASETGPEVASPEQAAAAAEPPAATVSRAAAAEPAAIRP